ncbi:MAG: hypothetical protein Q8P11_01775 [bacterium]|nr:hypothetical protein [bacterium]
MNFINSLGLIFGFIGTLFIIFYIRTDYKEHIENEAGQKPGDKWYALYVKHPNWLRFGVILLILGFLLQFIFSLKVYL